MVLFGDLMVLFGDRMVLFGDKMVLFGDMMVLFRDIFMKVPLFFLILLLRTRYIYTIIFKKI